MKKQAIKLNESQLRDIIKESIKKVLSEGYNQYQINDILNIIRNSNDIWVIRQYATQLYRNGVNMKQLPNDVTQKINQAFNVRQNYGSSFGTGTPLSDRGGVQYSMS